jgi:hypothetical protein
MFLACVAVLYPVFVWYSGTQGSLNTPSPAEIFPVFGLIAFSTMWLHVVGGALKSPLEKYFDFEKFVHWSSYIVLLSLILHPLLFFIAIGFRNLGFLWSFSASKLIWLAIAGWLLLITYDLGKIFKKRQFFIRHWETIKIISTIGFFLIFFHSLGLGSDLQTSPLRILWIFYGVSAAIAAVYTYVVRRLLVQKITS